MRAALALPSLAAVDDGSFESPALVEGESWPHTLQKPGIHPVHIVEHPSAKAEIVVE